MKHCIRKKSLELASMAINAKIVECEKRYSKGTSCFALAEAYKTALYDINNAIASFDDGES